MADIKIKVGIIAFLCALTILGGALVGESQERPRAVSESAPSSPAQTSTELNSDDIVRVRTRVVFIDALIKDARTNEPINDLTRHDFQVFDNGKVRSLTYFGGNTNNRMRPLALLLVLAPMDDGARKGFQRPEVLNSIAAALNKLPPEDEVAAMLLCRCGVGQMLVELTRDRGKVIAALGNLPKFAKAKYIPAARILQDFALSTVASRPKSQTTMVMLTDSVFLMSHADRNELDRNLIRANVSLNALITGTDKFFKFFYPLLIKEEQRGVSNFDVPQYLARRTGGDYVRPRHKKDYAAALERLIGDQAARYTLGFTLGENEPDDGQMHRLEVRIQTKDSQGRERKIEVSARQGYYLPE
jgi:VWFA-related protein